MIPFLPTPANYGPDVPPLDGGCNDHLCKESCQELFLNSDGSLSWNEFAFCSGDQCGPPFACPVPKCGVVIESGHFVCTTMFPVCAKLIADCEASPTCQKPLAWTVISPQGCNVPAVNCPPGTIFDSLSETCVARPPFPFIPPVLPTFCGLNCKPPLKLDPVACKCIDPPTPDRGLYV